MHPEAQFCPSCGAVRAISGPSGQSAVWGAVLARLTAATSGEFEILREVGRGAMGAVYLARDAALSRKVAIKVIAPELLADELMVARFRLEARTVASLRHPHIVTIHAVRTLDDLHYFVMDFVEGCSLRTILKTHGPLPIPIIQALLFQVGSALSYAHRRGRGVVHRDIKPANIMIDVEGNAFVTDFGISKVAESSSLTLTGTGLIIGTPEYMSPEQCMGEPPTGAGDQYSLGVVAYAMLCGHAPFTGSHYSVLLAHGSRAPEPIEDLRPDCPLEVREAVMRMMAKEPADRWPSVDDAVAAMGGAPLGHADPLRASIVALIPGSTGGSAGLDTSSPLSPVPGASKSKSGAPTTAHVAKAAGRIESSPQGDSERVSSDKAAAPSRWRRPMVGLASIITLVTIVLAVRGQLDFSPTAEQPTDQPVEPPAEQLADQSSGPDPGSASASVALVTVTMEPPRDVIQPGDTVRLASSATDQGGSPLSVGDSTSWSVDDPLVASVDSQGLVVALQVGSTRVYAAVGDVRAFVEIAVSAPDPVPAQTAVEPPSTPVSLPASASSVSLTLETPVMREQDTQEIDLSVLDAGGGSIDDLDRVSTRSSDPSVVSVSGTRVTALGPGSAYLIASIDDVNDSVFVTVEARVVTVSIPGGDVSLITGSTIDLTVEVRGSAQQLLGRPVTWLSLNSSVAQVDAATGRATANAPGQAVIVATSEGVEGRVTATVADEPELEAEPAEDTPPLLSDEQIALEVGRYVTLLNEGDEEEVRGLFGSAASTSENTDLLELMNRRDFTAELASVEPATTADGPTTVRFRLSVRYRSGFGGNREVTGVLAATFTLGPAGWRIESCTVVPGAGF